MKFIKGKKLSVMRLIGAFLVLIGLITTIFLDYFVLSNWLVFLILIISYLPWTVLSFSLKFEINYIKANILKISIIFGVYSIIFTIIGIILASNILLFITVLISNFLVLVCWHYLPSIYKKEKLFAIIAGITFIILNLTAKINPLVLQFGWLTGIISILIVSAGICLTLIIEQVMKSKGLLNYV